MKGKILVVLSLLLSFSTSQRTETKLPKANICDFSLPTASKEENNKDETALEVEKISISNKLRLKSSVETYFKNLCAYSPINSHGSCGYVSLIQLLSYYDTFYNDYIVPHQYDAFKTDSLTSEEALAVSPGVLRQDYPENGEKLFNFINNNYETDFQMKLMKIENEARNRSASDYSCSIGMWDYNSVLSVLYGSNKAYFDVHRYSDYSSSANSDLVKETFSSYVNEKLDDGKPVLLHIGKFDDSIDKIKDYHSVVAYYRDAQGIHCNYGWSENFTDVVIPDDVVITDVCSFDETTFERKHSDNYYFNNNYFCGCGEHVHTFTSYTYANSEYHYANCRCGAKVLKQHIFKQLDINNGGACAYCGYEKE